MLLPGLQLPGADHRVFHGIGIPVLKVHDHHHVLREALRHREGLGERLEQEVSNSNDARMTMWLSSSCRATRRPRYRQSSKPSRRLSETPSSWAARRLRSASRIDALAPVRLRRGPGPARDPARVAASASAAADPGRDPVGTSARAASAGTSVPAVSAGRSARVVSAPPRWCHPSRRFGNRSSASAIARTERS